MYLIIPYTIKYFQHAIYRMYFAACTKYQRQQEHKGNNLHEIHTIDKIFH
jgi:hypothetical protein